MAYSVHKGASQIIYGGSGEVEYLQSNATQIIHEGAYGFVDGLGGIQEISGGSGSAYNVTKWDGTQIIDGGGSGHASFLFGTQIVKDGIGSAYAIQSNGKQIIYDGASGYTEEFRYGGTQVILSGGYGEIKYMSNIGLQEISSGGTGYIVNLSGNVYGGGTQTINEGAQGSVENLASGGEQLINSGGLGIATIIKGGDQIIAGGTSEDAVVEKGIVYYKDNAGLINGMTMNGGEMLFNNDGKAYNVIGEFNFNSGIVDMAKKYDGGGNSQTYESLTIESFNGNGGTFVLNTDLENNSADRITIEDAAAGANAYVVIKDNSLLTNVNVTGDKELLLITDESGKATFEGKELSNGGLFTYTPELISKPADANSKDWYLSHVGKRVSNEAVTLINDLDNSYAMWRSTNDTLRTRMGELHNIKPDTDGVWTRYLGGKFDGSGFNSDYNMYQLGYDKVADAKSIYGFAVEKGNANANYTLGSSESDLFAGNLYGTWLADDGSYTDVIARFGRFDTDLNISGQFPDSADYGQNAYSLSVEYGKHIKLADNGLFVEPHVQFIAGHLEGIDFTTYEGKRVALDGVNSYIGRLGFTLGQNMDNGSSIYFKAAALHEFGGEGSIVMVNGAERLVKDVDYGDTWFELGLGGNVKLGHASYFYGEVERSFGGDIDKEWQINAGLKFEF